MSAMPPMHLFLLGHDYHLGDLVWFTTVLAEYKRQIQPRRLLVGCPDRPISHILDHHPLIDELLLGDGDQLLAQTRSSYGPQLLVHDLRPVPIAFAMLRDWHYYLPWLYYRDMWLQERGQWLATFLHLGRMRSFRPTLGLLEEDRVTARRLPSPYVALAPNIGQYRLPAVSTVWRRIKCWEPDAWTALADQLRHAGYTPVTLAAAGQPILPGTIPMVNLPIRQMAGVIEQAAALVTVESGAWFIAAACATPFVIVPWWLPHQLDWAAPMHVPHALVRRQDASPEATFAHLRQLVHHDLAA